MQIQKGETVGAVFTAGAYPAVVSGFLDIGERDTKYGPKLHCQAVFTLAEKDASGRQRRISRTFTQSLNENSHLSRFLIAILGEVPDLFDSAKFIGTQVVIEMAEYTRKDGTKKVGFASVKPAPADQHVSYSSVIKAMRMRRRSKPVPRCVCGRPVTHPPIPPGAPWPINGVPDEVIEAGHTAHEPDENCHCAVCNSLR